MLESKGLIQPHSQHKNPKLNVKIMGLKLLALGLHVDIFGECIG
jgi:hypothetical protein